MNKYLFVQGSGEKDKQVGGLAKKLGFNVVNGIENPNSTALEFSSKLVASHISTCLDTHSQITSWLGGRHRCLCEDVLGGHYSFIDKINWHMETLPDKLVKMTNIMGIDHIARRTSTLDNYYDLQKRLSNIGSLLGEKDINGRPVSIYQFHVPLRTSLGDIPYLKLIAPKQGKEYPDAYDHIEFVTKQNLKELLLQHLEIDFQTKGLYKEYNPELEIEFEDNLSIKFHNQPIDEILRYEDNIK